MTAGCAEVDVETSESAQTSVSMQYRVVPGDDLSRVECRTAAGNVYCSEAEAEAASRACSPDGRRRQPVVEARPGVCASSGPAYPTLSSCRTPRELDCSFYSACLERALPCGREGYALGFGEKYCTAFRAAPLSTVGKQWVTRVMGCLQKALVPDILGAGNFAKTTAGSTTCQNVFAKAFDSHPGCYTARESSICFLPPGDLATIMKTIGLAEILTRRTGGQIVSTAGICIGQISKRLVGFDQPRVTSGVGTRAIAATQEPGNFTREELELSLQAWQRLEAESDGAR